MKEYKTEQRKILLQFFAGNASESYSAEQVMAQLPSQQISRSAVYRNLDKMVQEGLLRKHMDPDGHKALFQYVDCSRHCERIHLQCEKCGRIFHMENAADEAKLKSVLDKSGFRLDEQATMLPGTCRDCLTTPAGKESECP